MSGCAKADVDDKRCSWQREKRRDRGRGMLSEHTAPMGARQKSEENIWTSAIQKHGDLEQMTAKG
jgi:hypothetical protein